MGGTLSTAREVSISAGKTSRCGPVRLRTGAEISGARFHRAEHVENVLHVRATTVILAPALNCSDISVRQVAPDTARNQNLSFRVSGRCVTFCRRFPLRVGPPSLFGERSRRL